MVHFMKVNGNWEEPKVKVNLHIQKEKSMRVNGFKTRLTAMEYIFIRMKLGMRVNGLKICNMGLVKRNGQMDRCSKANIGKEKRMA